MVRNDPLWKGIIQELIFPFLTFFFPEENFDFEREPQFLDKEQQVNTKLNLVRRLAKKDYDREYISTMMSFIRFYIILPNAEMNLIFDKKVEELAASKNIPMGVEEILLEQAEEKGRKQERTIATKKLKEAVRNMLREGLDVSFICKVLEVPEDFVRKIHTENL